MSSSIKLKNANGKTVSVTNSNANQTDKEVIYLNTVDELANASGSINAVAIVSDLNRGGTFVWSATGTANGGTVFAGASGYWIRQYSGAINVKWFGAVGDGVADDTVAIQTAINATGVIRGGVIRFQQGEYLVSDSIQIAYNNIYIYGDGVDNTIIIRNSDWSNTTFGNNLFVFASGNLTIEEGGVVNAKYSRACGFSNLTIKSNAKMNTVGALIYALNGVDHKYNNIKLVNGFQGLHLKGCVNSFVSNVTFHSDYTIMDDNRFGKTVALMLSFSRGTFKNSTVTLSSVFVQPVSYPYDKTKGYATGLRIESADGVWVSDSYFGCATNSNVAIGARIIDIASQSAKDAIKTTGIKFSNCWFDWGNGVSIQEYGLPTKVKSIEFANCTSYQGEGFGAHAYYMNSSYLDGIKIIGGDISATSSIPIYILKGNNIILNSISITRCNLASNPSTACVQINPAGDIGAVDGIYVDLCKLGTDGSGGTGLTTHGVIVGANTNNYSITNCDLRGNSSAGLYTNSLASTAGSIVISRNKGYRTDNNGYTVFNPGETAKVVTHNLARTPFSGDINLSINSAIGASMGNLYITNITSTTFTINAQTSPASPSTVRWRVESCSIVDF